MLLGGPNPRGKTESANRFGQGTKSAETPAASHTAQNTKGPAVQFSIKIKLLKTKLGIKCFYMFK